MVILPTVSPSAKAAFLAAIAAVMSPPVMSAAAMAMSTGAFENTALTSTSDSGILNVASAPTETFSSPFLTRYDSTTKPEAGVPLMVTTSSLAAYPAGVVVTVPFSIPRAILMAKDAADVNVQRGSPMASGIEVVGASTNWPPKSPLAASLKRTLPAMLFLTGSASSPVDSEAPVSAPPKLKTLPSISQVGLAPL